MLRAPCPASVHVWIGGSTKEQCRHKSMLVIFIWIKTRQPEQQRMKSPARQLRKTEPTGWSYKRTTQLPSRRTAATHAYWQDYKQELEASATSRHTSLRARTEIDSRSTSPETESPQSVAERAPQFLPQKAQMAVQTMTMTETISIPSEDSPTVKRKFK